MNVRTIDFIQSNGNPVNYYALVDKVVLKKSKDTINALVKGWFTSKILKLIDYLLIGLAASSIGALGSLILCFLIASKVGAI